MDEAPKYVIPFSSEADVWAFRWDLFSVPPLAADGNQIIRWIRSHGGEAEEDVWNLRVRTKDGSDVFAVMGDYVVMDPGENFTVVRPGLFLAAYSLEREVMPDATP